MDQSNQSNQSKQTKTKTSKRSLTSLSNNGYKIKKHGYKSSFIKECKDELTVKPFTSNDFGVKNETKFSPAPGFEGGPPGPEIMARQAVNMASALRWAEASISFSSPYEFADFL